MGSSSISRVLSAMAAGETGTFEAVPVYIVNYVAKVAFPRKFWYNACTKKDKEGRTCGKSVDAVNLCVHQKDRVCEAYIERKYRFDVIIVDALHGGKPLKGTMFETAANLIGVHVRDFSQWEPAQQASYLHDILVRVPLFEVKLRVANYSAVICGLSLKGEVDMENNVREMGGPSPLPPLPNYGNTSTAPTPSPSRRRASLSEAKIRDKVAKMSDMLLVTFLGEDDGIQGEW